MSFVNDVLARGKSVIVDAKTLLDLVTSQENSDPTAMETKLVNVARTLASVTHQLISVINARIKHPDNPTLAEEYVLSAAKDVRAGVLEFVQAVRSAASNPYDYLCQQTVDNRFKYLVTVVKNVVSAVESVEVEEAQQQKVNSATPATAAKDDKPIMLSKSEKQKRSGRTHVEAVRKHTSELDVALFDVESKERMTKVNVAAKSAVQSLYALMELSTELETDHAVELKRCAVQLVNATKGMMKDAQDPNHQQQFKQALRAIENITQTFFLAITPQSSTRTHADIDRIHRPSRPPPVPALSASGPNGGTLPTPFVSADSSDLPRAPSPSPSLPPPPLPPPVASGTLPKPPSTPDDNPKVLGRAATLNIPRNEQRANNNNNNNNQVRRSTSALSASAGGRPQSSTVAPADVARIEQARLAAASRQRSGSFNGMSSATNNNNNNQRHTQPFSGQQRTYAAAASDVIAVLRSDLNGFSASWKALSTAERQAVLFKCVEALERRLNRPMSREQIAPPQPSSNDPAQHNNPALVRARSESIVDDDQLRELSRMMGLEETSDYHEIRKAAATMRQKVEREMTASESNFRDALSKLDADKTRRLGNIQAPLEDHALDVLKTIGECVSQRRRTNALSDHAAKSRVVLAKLLEFLAAPDVRGPLPVEEEAVVARIFQDHVEAANALPDHAQLDENFVNAATADPKSADVVCNSIRERASRAQAQLAALLSQLLGELRLLDETVRYALGEHTGIPQSKASSLQEVARSQLTLQCSATARGFVDGLALLLQWVETYCYVASEIQDVSATKVATLRREPSTIGEPIWQPGNEKDEGLLDDSHDMLLPGNLNSLIRRLTSPDNYDNKFMKTFITTYRSFTEPWVLMNKLIERYNVPPSHAKDAPTIHLRVCIVLKYWIENYFHDLDDRTLARLDMFITGTLIADGAEEMANRLSAELKRCAAERDEAARSFGQRPRLNIPEFDRSPAKLLVQFPSNDIAQQVIDRICVDLSHHLRALQMTLIESAVFQQIQPSELLNQAWNKKHLKFRAPNVLEMISRSNKVSRFVASSIVWVSNKQGRASMYAKWIQVAEKLRKLNNFNTLMGVLAGLNMSSVNRLTHTIDLLSAKHREVKEALQASVSRNQSFKVYRETLQKASGPAVPFLGVYLTDLTFTEDGNPETVRRKDDPMREKLINFKKRGLVHNVISEVQLHQQQRYDFAKLEPLHTMLLEVPNQNEDELYALSLIREPRGADPSTIK